MRPLTTVEAHRSCWVLKRSALTERPTRLRPIPGSAKAPPAVRTLLKKLEAARQSVQSSAASSEVARALPSEPRREQAQAAQPIPSPKDSAWICVQRL